jgi:hypothetical protein
MIPKNKTIQEAMSSTSLRSGLNTAILPSRLSTDFHRIFCELGLHRQITSTIATPQSIESGFSMPDAAALLADDHPHRGCFKVPVNNRLTAMIWGQLRPDHNI